MKDTDFEQQCYQDLEEYPVERTDSTWDSLHDVEIRHHPFPEDDELPLFDRKKGTLIPVDVYKCFVDVYIGETAEEALEEFGKYYPDEDLDDDDFCARVYSWQLAGDYVMVPVLFVRKWITPGVIAHEALHICEEILVRKGIDFPGESWNYLLEYITDELCKELLNS